ncbi:hypothetical protein WJX84_001075 [Apatococcus fuscideae]|uniref:CRAL-TRIO domain-containing protein n=1 Tax=Apatococcus fuscideae TaxID=2026836 RepID=A0AAW1SDG3_9CHLO
MPLPASTQEQAEVSRLQEVLGERKVHLPDSLQPGNSLDATLLRFLRARQHDIEAAADMLENTVRWRREANVEDALSTFLPEKKDGIIRRHLPGGFLGYDKLGRPVWMENSAALDIMSLEAAGVSLDDFLFYHYRAMEYLVNCKMSSATAQAGRLIDSHCIILDLDGLRMGHLNRSTMAMFKAVAALYQEHYPELMSNMFLVNIPMVFSAVWRVLQMFVDDRIKAKIRFLKRSDLHVLHEFVPRENLPRNLGGLRDDKLISDKTGFVPESLKESATLLTDSSLAQQPQLYGGHLRSGRIPQPSLSQPQTGRPTERGQHSSLRPTDNAASIAVSEASQQSISGSDAPIGSHMSHAKAVVKWEDDVAVTGSEEQPQPEQGLGQQPSRRHGAPQDADAEAEALMAEIRRVESSPAMDGDMSGDKKKGLWMSFTERRQLRMGRPQSPTRFGRHRQPDGDPWPGHAAAAEAAPKQAPRKPKGAVRKLLKLLKKGSGKQKRAEPAWGLEYLSAAKRAPKKRGSVKRLSSKIGRISLPLQIRGVRFQLPDTPEIPKEQLVERTAPSFAFEDEIIRLVGRFPSAPQLTAPVPGLGTTNTSEARGDLCNPGAARGRQTQHPPPSSKHRQPRRAHSHFAGSVASTKRHLPANQGAVLLDRTHDGQSVGCGDDNYSQLSWEPA